MSPRRSGFTLIEMLVVLAIIGVMTGAAILSIGAADRSALPETEAHRLARALGLAADEVLVTQRALAISWTDKSFAFQASGAAPAEPDMAAPALPPALLPHALPGGIELTGPAAEGTLPIDGNTAMAFSISGGGQVWRIAFDGIRAAVRRVPS